MPSLSTLDGREFVRAFQITDRVIQKNQTIFMFTWIGSIISVLRVVLFSIMSLELRGDWLTILFSIVYLLSVQGVTMSIHLTLNNKISTAIAFSVCGLLLLILKLRKN